MTGLGIAVRVKTDLRLQKHTKQHIYLTHKELKLIAEQIPLTSLLDRKLATVALGIQKCTSI